MRQWLDKAIAQPWEAVSRVVPDEGAEIEAALRDLSAQCPLVLTTGGPGSSRGPWTGWP